MGIECLNWRVCRLFSSLSVESLFQKVELKKKKTIKHGDQGSEMVIPVS